MFFENMELLRRLSLTRETNIVDMDETIGNVQEEISFVRVVITCIVEDQGELTFIVVRDRFID